MGSGDLLVEGDSGIEGMMLYNYTGSLERARTRHFTCQIVPALPGYCRALRDRLLKPIIGGRARVGSILLMVRGSNKA
jgi:hypothetical protein